MDSAKTLQSITRPSTPKWEVVHVASGTVGTTGISKTRATGIARSMSGERKGSVVARRVRKQK
jgi:hypothetical protein